MKMNDTHWKRYSWKYFTHNLAVICLCFIGIDAIAQRVNSADKQGIVGAWTWTTQQSDGVLFTSVMDIEVTESNLLTGSIRNPKGDGIPFETVTMMNDRIAVILEYQIMGQTFKASYTGKLSGDKIDGGVVIQFQDRTLRRVWKVRRMQEFPLSGEWDWKLSTPDGNELKGILTIHHNANGVSGRLVSDQFNMPLQDVSFLMGKLSFMTKREEDGGTFYSTGKWHGNLLSGEVSSPSIGDELKLPWEARKRP